MKSGKALVVHIEVGGVLGEDGGGLEEINLGKTGNGHGGGSRRPWQ